MIRFFHRKIKTNTTIASYTRFCCMCSLSCSLHLLSPLVFTATTFEISFFKAPEKQYPRFEKVRVRSSRSTKNSKPFLKFLFLCNISEHAPMHDSNVLLSDILFYIGNEIWQIKLIKNVITSPWWWDQNLSLIYKI